MAFRMQTSVPELTDLSGEPPDIIESYGPDVHKAGSYAANCLMARRLLERGVRFVQLFHRGWDQHIAIKRQLPNQCHDVDQPTAALLNDLKQRGLLEDTLVMFLTEFGRTVFSQGVLGDPNTGRDHHGRCFTVWLAGAGVKPGIEYGRTDDFCYNIAENPVHLRDLHATMLHILGIDHTRFTYPFRGLDTQTHRRRRSPCGKRHPHVARAGTSPPPTTRHCQRCYQFLSQPALRRPWHCVSPPIAPSADLCPFPKICYIHRRASRSMLARSQPDLLLPIEHNCFWPVLDRVSPSSGVPAMQRQFVFAPPCSRFVPRQLVCASDHLRLEQHR